MIKILKQGNENYRATCTSCGCEFEYENEDVWGNLVKCPCCGKYVAHRAIGIATPAKPSPVIDDMVYRGSKESNIPNLSVLSQCETCWFYQQYLASGKTYAGDSPCLNCSYPKQRTLG